MLDARLQAVAAQIRHGSRMADIGTDHAYLPVHLVSAGICPSAIASDLREGPLAAAARTVSAAGLSDRIDLRLADGLAAIAPDEAEDVAIAGMGGETIVAILQAAASWRTPHHRFVLQPMTRAEDLRAWLLHHGFAIEQERLVIDGRHLYPVMTAAYTAAPPPTDDLAVYAGFFSREEGAPYRQMMAAHLCRRAEGLRRAGDTAAADALQQTAVRLNNM